MLNDLIAPLRPPRAKVASKQLQVGTRRAPFDQIIDLLRLPRMFAFASRHQVHLPPARSECAHAPTDSEENQFGHIAKIETHTTPVWSAVLANLVPHDVSLVSESPAAHRLQTFSQEGVWNPEVQMAPCCGEGGHRQFENLLELHSGIAEQAFVFGRHFACSVHELPRGVRQNRGKLTFHLLAQIFRCRA